jgi:hypothetical protein
LIKQKILVNIEKVQGFQPTRHDNHFILFLPENEIHELGLTDTNYEIIRRGYTSIYLGQSVPINCLKSFLSYNDKITFITYFTVEPSTDKIPEYINEIISKCNSELWVLGRLATQIENIIVRESIKFLDMPEMTEIIKNRSQQPE